MSTEYAQRGGVDYTKIEPFKMAMKGVAEKTRLFPMSRNVIVESAEHGATFEYIGQLRHKWTTVLEGLGNKNWIAEWMYCFSGTGKTYYDTIAIDNALMAINDLVAQGAMPVLYEDEVAAGDSEWFDDKKRASDFAEGMRYICMVVRMALGGGESPSLKYLVNSTLPVESAPVLSGLAIGLIAPASREVKGENLAAGDVIIGVRSSGLHSNGVSLVISRAMELPDQFMTKLPNGNTLGEEALIPTMSYVGLVEALLDAGVEIHALLPGTGSGLSKIAFDKRPFTYRIHSWTEVPLLFQYMFELGVSLKDCLKTFNWGVGYYIYLPKSQADWAIQIGQAAGYDLMEIGVVEEGERKVIFEPEGGLELPPPGD